MSEDNVTAVEGVPPQESQPGSEAQANDTSETPPLSDTVKSKLTQPKLTHPRTKFRTVDPSDCMDIAIEGEGLASEEPTTIGAVFKEAVSKLPNHPALKFKEEGVYKEITYKQYYTFVLNAAKSLLKCGLEQYHGVNVIGFNSPEWLIANLAAIFAGGLAAGIYTTSGPEACRYVANNCKANVIFVENQKQLEKILQVRDNLPHLKAIVQYKGKLSEEYPDVYDWEQFMELGKDMEDTVIEEKIAAQKPQHCAQLIYTSGTTGNPKGVMLSHDNVTWTAKCLIRSYGRLEYGKEHTVSYLPLSHMAAQMTDIYFPISLGGTIHFAQPDALKGTLVDTLKDAHPTIFFGVPRVYEKFMERMQEKETRVTGVRKRVSSWATKKGRKGNFRRQHSGPLPRGWSFADRLVFKKVQEALGLNKCKIFVIGSAPTRREVHEFFMGYNMPLMELYGMSESTGPQTLNLIPDNRWRTGSCGPKLLGVHLKIDKPDENGEGEICYYGRHVFMGYLNNEEKTKEAIDDEGWLHSGDIGRIDEDGFLYVTGRIKELIITSGGENIPPVLIENSIKKELPFLSNVFVIGDHRKYLTCLVTLKSEVDMDTGEPQDQLTHLALDYLEALGSNYTTPSKIVETKDQVVYEAIQDGLDRANQQATSNAQRVQKFTVLSKDFSIPGGELGPTLKVRRPKVVEKYEEVIDAMYA